MIYYTGNNNTMQMHPWREVIFESEVLKGFTKQSLHCHQTVTLLLLLLKNTSSEAQQDIDWQWIQVNSL